VLALFRQFLNEEIALTKKKNRVGFLDSVLC
jgi:hypothetical protein